MNKQENVLTEVYYQERFEDVLILDNDKNIVLNTMEVYTLKENSVDKRVNFDIHVSGNKMIIQPLEHSDAYVLHCQRIMNATIIKINANDYFEKKEHDGNFTFYMENNKL